MKKERRPGLHLLPRGDWAWSRLWACCSQSSRGCPHRHQRSPTCTDIMVSFAPLWQSAPDTLKLHTGQSAATKGDYSGHWSLDALVRARREEWRGVCTSCAGNPGGSHWGVLLQAGGAITSPWEARLAPQILTAQLIPFLPRFVLASFTHRFFLGATLLNLKSL